MTQRSLCFASSDGPEYWREQSIGIVHHYCYFTGATNAQVACGARNSHGRGFELHGYKQDSAANYQD